MYKRHIVGKIVEALGDTPVVLVHGARQVGKSTLVQALAATDLPGQYLTLDDLDTRRAAVEDPVGLLAGHHQAVVIDEVQRVPELLIAIKREVDRERRPGRFLLTGSANVMTLPAISESLAGRVEICTLWPLSQSELAGAERNVVDLLLSSERLAAVEPGSRDDLLDRVVRGGYPEAVARPRAERRAEWFASYLRTILERDVRDVARIGSPEDMFALLRALAARAGNLVNHAAISNELKMAQTTLRRYSALLKALFLVSELPSWSRNLASRQTKSPKVLINDPGLACHLLGLETGDDLAGSPALGGLVEAFAAAEVRKHVEWCDSRARLFHFRTSRGTEVDLVLERPNGQVVGIEVKAAATVGSQDLAGLRLLQETLGHDFVRGVVLYTGTETKVLGERLVAVPFSLLWSA